MSGRGSPTTATPPALRLEHALALHRRGDHEAASCLYELVLRDQPDHADALHLLGVARRAQGRAEDAVALIRSALERLPDHADAWHNLGNALLDLGRVVAAAEAFARAVALRPAHVGAWCGLGVVRAKLGDVDGAIDAYRRALALDPDHVASRHNLANQLIENGQDEAAASELRAVLARAPELAEAHYNLARALLRLGDYTTGFAEYAWRWRATDFPDRLRRAELPEWDGRGVSGRALLVQAEQGLGDTIQMVRLLPLLASLGPRTILEVPERLVGLLAGVPGVDRLVPIGSPAPDAEFRVALFDLPARLGLTLGSIPASVPYLRADPDRVARWRGRLAPDGRLRVGLCWRGNPRSPADRGRSLPSPSPLAAALDLPGVRLVALTAPDAHPLVPGSAPLGWRLAEVPTTVEHPGPDLDAGPHAFLDTAALLGEIDLLVTTDTALAHLAGALARPTLLLLASSADWRWLARRSDSPWYPTFRLLRQERRGDWSSVLDAARATVQETAAHRKTDGR